MEATVLQKPAGGIGFFEKWLSVWVAACIVAGIVLGNLLPGLFGFLAGLEYASVNLVVAVLIWAMVFPMMVNVDFASLAHIGDRPKGLLLTVVVNWLIKPFTMAALGVLFFEYVFAAWIAPADAQQYIAGLILLGAAPCTAMVFVWSQMTRGDPTYTLVQVSVNDVIMIFAFAPIVALLLGVTDIVVPWETLLLATALYVLIPLAVGAATRQWLIARAHGENPAAAVSEFTAKLKPVSVLGLLVHQRGKGGFAAAHGFGQRHGGVVARLHDHALVQFVHRDRLARLDEHARAARAPRVLGHRHGLLQRQALFVQRVEHDVGRHDLGERGRLDLHVGVGCGQRLAAVHIDDDPGLGRDGGSRDGRHVANRHCTRGRRRRGRRGRRGGGCGWRLLRPRRQ